jgi:hypothetical protein
MHVKERWYEREHWPYMVDRERVEAYAHWLKQVRWRLFGTFTFAWRVSDQQADKTFAEFINRLERHLKCDIGYVRGDEKRFSGCGKPACARHYHVLLATAAQVSPGLVEAIWMSMAGNRSDNAGAVVKPYNPKLNGVSYVLKLITQPEGNWESRKLHLFHPSVSVGSVTSRMRRHLRRHPALKQFKEA